MKLIIINGPAGVGKTTIAKKLHSEMSFSYLLDLDEQRNFISEWQSNRNNARVLSCNIALAIAEQCFKKNVDFIIGKTMLDIILPGNDKNILDLLVELGKKYQAEIYEIILWADKQNVIDRANKRGYKIKTHLNSDKVMEEWRDMKIFKEKRKNAILVDTNNLSSEKVLTKIKGIIKHGKS